MSLLTERGNRLRTVKNVQMSDGTAIPLQSIPLRWDEAHARYVHPREETVHRADAMQNNVERAVKAVLRFIDENEILVLNVAGPRLSGWPEGYGFALAVVGGVIGKSGDR